MNEPPGGGVQSTGADAHHPLIQASLKRYWRSNITLMAVLLGCWAVVGLGCGVLFADWLNQFRPFGGFPLGFWFAQQGSIIGFVLIILIYALAMNRLDKKHHEELTRLRDGGTSGDVSGGGAGGVSGGEE
jgi:putative solute:sodium symporter small subunit